MKFYLLIKLVFGVVLPATAKPIIDLNDAIATTDAFNQASAKFYAGESDTVLLAKARVVVSRNLRDPESARFRDLRVIHARVPGSPAMYICGAVNAKNGFGGYNGYKTFYANAFGPLFQGENPTKDAVIAHYCTGR